MYKFYFTVLFLISFLISEDRLKQARVTEFIATRTIEYVDNIRSSGDTKEYLLVSQNKAFFERAKVRLELGKLSDALLDINKVIFKNPDFIRPYYYRGQIYFSQQEYALAINDFDLVILNELFMPDVIARKIESQFEIYRDNSILLDINSFINTVDPRHPNIGKLYFFKGALLFKQENFIQALENIDKAISLSPEIWEAYMIRGNIYRMQGKLEKAFFDLDIAINSKKCPKDVFLYRGLAYATSKDFKKSIEDLTKFLQLTPGYHQSKPEAILQRAIARYYEGSFNTTIDDLNEVLRREPEHWLVYRLLGLTYLKKENYSKALKNFNIAIEHGDNDADIYFHRGLTQMNLFSYKKAMSDLSLFIDNVSESHPDYALALNKRGLSLFFMKKLTEACTDWNYSFSLEIDNDTNTFIKKHCIN